MFNPSDIKKFKRIEGWDDMRKEHGELFEALEKGYEIENKTDRKFIILDLDLFGAGNRDYTTPNIYIGLSTTLPTDAGGNITEPMEVPKNNDGKRFCVWCGKPTTKKALFCTETDFCEDCQK